MQFESIQLTEISIKKKDEFFRHRNRCTGFENHSMGTTEVHSLSSFT